MTRRPLQISASTVGAICGNVVYRLNRMLVSIAEKTHFVKKKPCFLIKNYHVKEGTAEANLKERNMLGK